MPERPRAHTEASSAMSQYKLLTSYTTLSLLTLLLLFHIPLIRSASSSKQATQAGCINKRCGTRSRVDVSYPFALDNQPECLAFSEFFRLHCNETISKVFINIITRSKLFINTTSGYSIRHATLLEVTSITSDSLVIDIGSVKASLSAAHSKSYCGDVYSSSICLPPYPGPFLISKDNQIHSTSCTYASYYTADITYNSSISLQSALDSDSYYDYNYTILESCSCVDLKCQNVTLKYLSRFAYQFVDDQYGYSPAITNCCAPNGGFGTFFHPNFTDFTKEPPLIQLQLTWALPSNSASHGNACYNIYPNTSDITIVQEVPGYRCFCRPGYTGDGYLHGSGCKDVDECTDGTNDCVYGSSCHNQNGNYTCSCKYRLFYVGDGYSSGSGCHFQFPNWLKFTFAISGGIVGFGLIRRGFVYLALRWGQWRKRKYFLRNGGLQMQAYLRMRPGREMTRLFRSEELTAATNNYAEDMKIGEGGFGVVFKGMLNDGRPVAIKKAKIMGCKLDGAERRQFLNEMAILTQINHRHIVQLLGFCLETDTPLLLYEYVSNGNLAENLEGKGGTCVILSWEQRLKVARQTAEALAYLHAAASPAILHRDVKSSNVLLDGNLDAKISDFGLSRLVPDGVKQVSTVVQGTIGYLDPEYFQTMHLTDKSDVYSLGVMLTELITGLKALDSRNRSEPCFANLALLFIHRMQEGKLDELIDVRLSAEVAGDATVQIHSSIIAVAGLARQCLALEGRMRPSMSQVRDELRHISRSLEGRRGIEDDDDAVVEPAGASVLLIESDYLDSGSVVDLEPFSSTIGR